MPATSIYDDIVNLAASTYAVPPDWIKGVIGAETSFLTPPKTWEPKVQEYAVGPMQILLSTARGLGFTGTVDELAEPLVNIPIGAAYLAELRGRYGDDFRAVYSAYNSGSPTMWQISSKVRANVERALSWLEQAGGAAAEDLPFELVLIPILAGGLWWLYHHARREKVS